MDFSLPSYEYKEFLHEFSLEDDDDFKSKLAALAEGRLSQVKPDFSKIRAVAIIMPTKGLGDGIIFSGLYDYFQTAGISVFIVCRPSTAFFYKKHPSVGGVIEYSDELSRESVVDVIQSRIDIAIDMYGDNVRTPQRLRSLYALNPRYSIVFNGNGISQACFTHNINYQDMSAHLTDRIDVLMDALNAPLRAMPYSIPLTAENEEVANRFMSQISGVKIGFCPFASNSSRSLSPEKASSIAECISRMSGASIILLGQPYPLSKVHVTNENIFYLPSMNFFDVCAVVSQCDMLLTVDTSIIHVGNCFKKSAVALYNSELMGGLKINVVFSPGYAEATQLVSSSYAVNDIDEANIISETLKTFHQLVLEC